MTNYKAAELHCHNNSLLAKPTAVGVYKFLTKTIYRVYGYRNHFTVYKYAIIRIRVVVQLYRNKHARNVVYVLTYERYICCERTVAMKTAINFN